jgi:hypothetical protein
VGFGIGSVSPNSINFFDVIVFTPPPPNSTLHL